MQAITVALIGDHDQTILAHKAIPLALQMTSSAFGRPVEWEWRATSSILPGAAENLQMYDCIWCVPGSPYESEAGALEAIRVARESGKPFLGTCGGCQHAILEYARNVLGYTDAGHSESHPETLLPLIAPLSCALVETRGTISLEPGTTIERIYGRQTIEEGYHCSFGLNPRLEHLLDGTALKITGRDPGGEARALELVGHPFFVMTQFQPERSALAGTLPPVVSAFIAAASDSPRGKGEEK
jgi:CTP synthase (UTP-ammonia lyase)